MVNLTTAIAYCRSDNVTLSDFFLSSYASICSTVAFPSLGNSDHVTAAASNDFPSNSRAEVPFHCKTFDYIILTRMVTVIF